MPEKPVTDSALPSKGADAPRKGRRIVCHFSCGAASAVAAKLTLASYGPKDVVILNAFLAEEHPDNRRFLADCEKWFDHPIAVVRDEKYGASAQEVWRRKRFLSNGLWGAPCSSVLKRSVIDAHVFPGDVHVFGFTRDEKRRADRWLVHNDNPWAIFPLISRNLSHADCLGMIERAGIRLPEMYRLGFNNANCIGCCKGGEGYWNKVREVFPDQFAQVVQIQESIGPNSYLFRDRHTGQRYGLKDLAVGAGRHDEEIPECSFFCDMAEQDIAAGNIQTPASAVPGDDLAGVPTVGTARETEEESSTPLTGKED
jgi:hypothetical protein